MEQRNSGFPQWSPVWILWLSSYHTLGVGWKMEGQWQKVFIWEYPPWEGLVRTSFLRDASSSIKSDCRPAGLESYCAVPMGQQAQPGKPSFHGELFKKKPNRTDLKSIQIICHDTPRSLTLISVLFMLALSTRALELEWRLALTWAKVPLRMYHGPHRLQVEHAALNWWTSHKTTSHSV